MRSKKRFLAVPAAMMIALGTVGVGYTGVAQAAPAKPTNVVATAGAAAATVTWRAGTGAGDPVTNYTIEATSATGVSPVDCTAGVTDLTALRYVCVGLTPDASYTFVVTANGMGATASDPSNAVVPTVPGAPTGVTVSNAAPTATDAARVSWTAPAAASISPSTISGYQIRPYINGAAQALVPVTSATTNFTLTGLTAGAIYRFEVRAIVNNPGLTDPINAQNFGAWSAISAPFVPWTVPTWGAGGSGLALDGAVSNRSAAVEWTPIDGAAMGTTDTGGFPIANYTVTATPTAGSAVTCTTTATACVLTGLAPGMSYGLTMIATSTAPAPRNTSAVAIGPGFTVPATSDEPSPPLNVSAVAGFAQATVSWTAPTSSGDSGIASYEAEAFDDAGNPPMTGGTCTVLGTPPATSCTMTGLVNGTAYNIFVTAENANGEVSLPGGPARVTPGNPTAPSAPGTPTAVAGVGEATVTWTAPASQGSSAVTGYTVTGTPGGTCTTTTALTCTITGLTAGTSYTFTVVARNAVGTSPASAASAAVTPTATVPGAPTSVRATAGDAKAAVTWTAPASTGGAAITGYTVTSTPGSRTCTTTGTLTCEVTGLTNGTAYTFTVVARNSVGAGAASAASNSVTPTDTPVTRTILIEGTRGTGSDANRIFVDGITTGLVGRTVTPFFRLPGQTGFTAGTGTRTVDAQGDFSWTRKTGKRIVVEFRLGSELTSNRIVIQAR